MKKKYTIVLIEDCVEIALLIKDTLSGHDVRHFIHPPTDTASYVSAHLVILDYDLPGTEGYECLQYVREHLPGTPVIIISSRICEKVRREAIQHGVSDYLLKPFSPADLRKAVEIQLEHALPSASPRWWNRSGGSWGVSDIAPSFNYREG